MRRFMAACGVLALLSGSSLAQDESGTSPRTVQLEPSIPHKVVRIPEDLIKVAKLMVGDTEVQPGVPFQADDDWFSHLKLVIKNVSSKRIVFAAGYLRFPDTGDAKPENLAVLARMSVGQRPEHARQPNPVNGLRYHDAPSLPILVGPGQELALPVVDSFDLLRAKIEKKQPVSTVKTCFFGLTHLYFDDGTLWLSGIYFRADPGTPPRHVLISREQFEEKQESTQ